jgi:Domain of unknown function (DUF4333)
MTTTATTTTAMTTTVRAGMKAAIGLAALGLLAVACGSGTIKADGAAQSVVDVVSQQTSFHPNDVNCPSGVEAKAGKEFDCHFTGPEGRPYTAHLKITNVDGDNVKFDIKTFPTYPMVRPDGAAQSVVDLVSQQTGFRPSDVSCPPGVDAKVGGEFDCHFTGPEGAPYTAHLKITSVDGDNINFDIRTFLS